MNTITLSSWDESLEIWAEDFSDDDMKLIMGIIKPVIFNRDATVKVTYNAIIVAGLKDILYDVLHELTLSTFDIIVR